LGARQPLDAVQDAQFKCKGCSHSRIHRYVAAPFTRRMIYEELPLNCPYFVFTQSNLFSLSHIDGPTRHNHTDSLINISGEKPSPKVTSLPSALV
jgi:hypothetical protein